MSDTVNATEGSDVRLPCVSEGNPATKFTQWTRDGKNVSSNPRFAVLEKGSLLIQRLKRTDVGDYACTPYNTVGAGTTKITKLGLKGRCQTKCRSNAHFSHLKGQMISVTELSTNLS